MKRVLTNLTYTKTQKQILDETNLSPRTFRFAISRLKKIGLIKEIVSLKDARIKFCRRMNKTKGGEKNGRLLAT